MFWHRRYVKVNQCKNKSRNVKVSFVSRLFLVDNLFYLLISISIFFLTIIRIYCFKNVSKTGTSGSPWSGKCTLLVVLRKNILYTIVYYKTLNIVIQFTVLQWKWSQKIHTKVRTVDYIMHVTLQLFKPKSTFKIFMFHLQRHLKFISILALEL